jgi:hypothetical protein
MKKFYLLIVTVFILFCIVPIIPSYSACEGTFKPKIQKDNGTDMEGYHTYQVSSENNQTYPVKYKISSLATLEWIGYQKEFPAFNIIVREVPQGGILTLQLPTNLLGLYSAGGFSVAEGAMCAGQFWTTFPTPIESNSNFTTVEFPLMKYSGVDENIYIVGNHVTPEFPFATIMLALSIVLTILLYQFKYTNRFGTTLRNNR